MALFRLILDPQGAAFDVDDAILIGTCAARLAAQLGYPTADSAGMPVIYQLRLTNGGSFLPNDRRFRDLRLAAGTRLVLASSAASVPMRPVPAVGLTSATHNKPRTRRRWSRRAFLTTGTLAAFALTGLGTGLAVALAQRYFGRKRPAAVPLVTPTASSTTARHMITATPVLTFASHQQTVRVVAWSPDGRYLASGGDDGLLLVWGTDGVIRQRVAYPATVTALAWSPESERLVTSLAWTAHNQQQVVSGALDQRAIVWQTTQYQPQTIFTRHNAPIEAVSWAVDGQTVASSSHGGVVRVWNAETGREVHPLYQDARLPMRLQSLHSPIRSLAWSPDARYLASGGDDGSFSLWDPAQNQKPLLTMSVQLGSAVQGLAWSPEGPQLATASGKIVIVWDLHTA